MPTSLRQGTIKTTMWVQGLAVTAIALAAVFLMAPRAWAIPATPPLTCTANGGGALGSVCNPAAPQPDCQCGTSGASNLVCQNTATCNTPLTFFLSNDGVSNSTISSLLIPSNGNGGAVTDTCVGRLVACNATAGWGPDHTILGAGNTETFSGLRPSRTHTFAYQAIAQYRTTTTSGEHSLTTWPGYMTNLNASQSGNFMNISWNTPFMGNTELVYGLNPRTWERIPIAGGITNPVVTGAGDNMWSIGIVSAGELWAFQYNRFGMASTNKPNANFSVTSASNYSSGNGNLWIVGGSGVAYQFNGIAWQNKGIPGGEALYNVFASKSNTAWAVGSNRSVYFYDGTAWARKWWLSGGVSLRSVVTLNDKEILVVGDGGSIFRSQDGGATWATITSGVPATDILYSVSTLDGKNIWVAGTGGNLWVSRSYGDNATWAPVNSGTTSALFDLNQVTPDELYFASSPNGIGYCTNAAASPSCSFPSELDTSFGLAGNPIRSFSMMNGGIGYATSASGVAKISIASPTSYVDATNTQSHLLAIDTSSLPAGTYSYIATTFGTSIGATAGHGTFTVIPPDPTPPTITITDPPTSPKTVVKVPTYTVKGTAADNVKVTGVTVKNVTTGATVNATLTDLGAGNYTWTAPVALTDSSPALKGENDITATATDGVNFTTTPVSKVFYDKDAPTVSFYPPMIPEGSVTSAPGGIGIFATAHDVNDFTNITKFEYQLNGHARVALPFPPSRTLVDCNGCASFSPDPGANTLTVYATDEAGNVGTAVRHFTYTAPDYSVTSAKPSLTAYPGLPATLDVTVATVTSYTGNITMGLSIPGVTFNQAWSVNPAQLNPATSVTTTLTLTPAASTAPGKYTMTISGNDISAGKIRTTDVMLIIAAPPDFTLTATPPSQTITPGNSKEYQVTMVANATFSGQVTLTVNGNPAGTTASWVMGGMTNLTPGSTGGDYLHIDVTAAAIGGTYPLTITATSTVPPVTHTVNVTLIIPDYTISVTPDPLTVIAGSATPGTYTGTLTGVGGYTGSATVTALTTRPDITLTAPSGPVTIIATPTNFNVTAKAASTVPRGNYLVTITADSGGLKRSKTVMLRVDPDITPPVISNIVATPNYDKVTVTWDTNEPANSSITIFSTSCQCAASFVGSNFDASYVTTNHSLVYTPLLPLTQYWFTVTSADPAGNTTTAKEFSPGNILTFTTLEAPDNEPPKVWIDFPTTGTTVAGNVTIAGHASDNKSVLSVNLNVAPTPGAATLPCVGATCNFSDSWATLSGPNGTYTLTAIATDSAGNVSTPAVVTVTVNNDLSKPNVLSGPNAEVFEDPGNMTCGGQCYKARITWSTDDQSTSEVDYADDGYYTAHGNAYDPANNKQYDDKDTAKTGLLYTDHQVTISDLPGNMLYHYRITSCNISKLCTN